MTQIELIFTDYLFVVAEFDEEKKGVRCEE
jgi:hypothetical protein